MTRVVLAILAFTAVYLLALASIHPWDVAFGLAFSTLLVIVARPFVFPSGTPPLPGLLRRILGIPMYAAVVSRDIVVGTWTVSKIVLGIAPLSSPGIVAIPFGERTNMGVVLSAFIATLSPGEFLVDIDWDRGVYYLHVVDGSDPDATRAYQEHLYQRYQKPVFP